MPLTSEQKADVVKKIHHHAKHATSALMVDCAGLKVEQLTQLRQLARAEQSIHLQVVKNTLLKRALKGTDFAGLSEACQGQTMIAFSALEPNACARLFQSFIKDYQACDIKALAVGDVIYSGDFLDKIAALPSKDEALSQLLSVLQAPIAQLMRTINEPVAKLVRTLAAVKDSK